jgi:hypothetical protein
MFEDLIFTRKFSPVGDRYRFLVTEEFDDPNGDSASPLIVSYYYFIPSSSITFKENNNGNYILDIDSNAFNALYDKFQRCGMRQLDVYPSFLEVSSNG